jgi:hypothetical protein
MNRCGSASLITNIVRCSRLSPRKVLRQDTVEIGKSSEYSPSNHLNPARPVSEPHGGEIALIPENAYRLALGPAHKIGLSD